MQCPYENKPCEKSNCPHAPEKFFENGKTENLCHSLQRITEAAKSYKIDGIIDMSNCTWRKVENKPIEQKKEEPIVTKNKPVKYLEKKKSKGKMTMKRFIFERLDNNVLSVEELAQEYIAEGHAKKNACAGKLKFSFSAQISLLRKEGYPIEKIKRGRYGIRKEN